MSERLSDEALAEWREYSASGAQARMLALAYPPTEILAAIDELIELRAENAKLRAGIEAVYALIRDSHGVIGLHLNGDEAPWDELRTGGTCEDWLRAFDEAWVIAARGTIHVHAASQEVSDICARCGLDIRNKIHKRAEDSTTLMIANKVATSPVREGEAGDE